MLIFRCLMRGENFPGVLLGKVDPVGFYATRYVEAASAEDAELAALALLRDDQTLSVPAQARTENAQVFFEEIEELSTGDEQGANAGFTFFSMGT